MGEFQIGQQYFSDYNGDAYLHTIYEVVSRSNTFVKVRNVRDGNEYRRKLDAYFSPNEVLNLGSGEWLDSENTIDRLPSGDRDNMGYAWSRRKSVRKSKVKKKVVSVPMEIPDFITIDNTRIPLTSYDNHSGNAIYEEWITNAGEEVQIIVTIYLDVVEKYITAYTSGGFGDQDGWVSSRESGIAIDGPLWEDVINQKVSAMLESDIRAVRNEVASAMKFTKKSKKIKKSQFEVGKKYVAYDYVGAMPVSKLYEVIARTDKTVTVRSEIGEEFRRRISDQYVDDETIRIDDWEWLRACSDESQYDKEESSYASLYNGYTSSKRKSISKSDRSISIDDYAVTNPTLKKSFREQVNDIKYRRR